MVAGEEFPQFDEFGEIFSYENQWHGLLPQTVTGIDCFNPSAAVNSDENLIVLKLTAQEYREMFTSIYAGAELQYPEKYLQVIANFLKGIHCPPILEEQDCFEYLSYASFIRFEPVNPYLEPDTVPDGYLTQPFLVNGQNGVDIPNYEPFDILVPLDSLTLDVNWFEDIGGQLPQITIGVQGAGQVLVKLLTQVAGGLAVITVDNPPNLLDIIAGVLTGAENIMDLNLDIVSLPPETATEIDYPLDIVGAGLHTIYIVFLPILDDSLIPVRFGGGFRGVTLCDFVEQPDMGIQDIRFDDLTCSLQTLIDGVWTDVSGWENWLDCIPEGGGGGGGGGGSIATKVYRMGNIGFGTITTTSTTYVDMAGMSLNHTPTKANMLVIVDNILLTNSAGNQPINVRILADGNAGIDAIEQAVSNSAHDKQKFIQHEKLQTVNLFDTVNSKVFFTIETHPKTYI